jgi:hypothetical protein
VRPSVLSKIRESTPHTPTLPRPCTPYRGHHNSNIGVSMKLLSSDMVDVIG